MSEGGCALPDFATTGTGCATETEEEEEEEEEPDDEEYFQIRAR